MTNKTPVYLSIQLELPRTSTPGSATFTVLPPCPAFGLKRAVPPLYRTTLNIPPNSSLTSITTLINRSINHIKRRYNIVLIYAPQPWGPHPIK
jgi:hypothetical protein